ncbi:MAG: hypothetical protein KDK70_11930 [Myxococcales bacterium]|nr:hypothetical protein [Myxococcales bacterium]
MIPLLATLLLLQPPAAGDAPLEPTVAPAESTDATASAPADDVQAKPEDEDHDYGPFFRADAPSDPTFASQGRKGKAPRLSVGQGAFCFVDGSHCKVSLLADASVAAGLRAPASNKGPDVPYAHYAFRGGLVMRPLMFKRKAWHPWGVGVVGSWSMGTGAVTVEANNEEIQQRQTDATPAARVALVNQLWLNQKPHAPHLDFTLGGVRSPVLTSGLPLIGTHAELAFGWGGWGAVFASGDFLDQDTRVSFGFRAHGIAAGPLIGLAILGAALGGAL